jgi:hypothetical protein
MQSELASACAAHAGALADADGPGQLDAACRFAELGVDILCAEAAAGAARALGLEGRDRDSGEAAALATRHAARCQRAPTPAMAQVEELVQPA